MSRVADTTLYDDLGVRPGASDTEIRKVSMYRDRQMSFPNVIPNIASFMFEGRLHLWRDVLELKMWCLSMLCYQRLMFCLYL